MKYPVTLYFWLVFAIFAPIECLLGVLLAVLSLPFDPDGRLFHAFVSRWTFQYLRVWPGWKIRVTGRERLPKGPAVLVCNHQSMADVVVVMALFHPFKFVSKASLFRVPLVGQMMRLARYVEVDRGKRSSHQQMMDDCREWLSKGTSLMVFPEGTYREGEDLLPFKRGAFVLAIEAGVPVVPLALKGTGEWIWGDGPWMSPRANVELSVLDAVYPQTGENAGSLADRVREQIRRALSMTGTALPPG